MYEFKFIRWPAATLALSLVLLACSSPPTDDTSERPVAEHPVAVVPQPTPPQQGKRQEPAEAEVRLHDQDISGSAKGKVVMSERKLSLANTALPALAMTRQAPGAPFYQDQGRERYDVFSNNGVFWASKDPVSTFSIDVDSAAYANMRRQLNEGQLPNPDSIRVEELINYFAYDYPRTRDADTPFTVYTEMGPSPWHSDRKLVHIGINGWQADSSNLPPANLVFLIDVSGSMQAPNKIQLLKSAMKMMVNQLRPQDRVAIAVYAGAAGEVLAPTPGDQKATIMQAINNLRAGGSTNGGAGIRLAYNLARQHYAQDGVNRVILATDGDFNVGTTDAEALERLVENERKSGVALTVLGFGTGNYNDHMMQKIAQIGNGNAAYIDTINEARKVLVEELGATLNIIAKDMKVQVEFNPDMVETYRLVGYETRHLNREDFNNDKVDAGEVGAGHTVTALYEITLQGDGAGVADPLRYGTDTPPSRTDTSSEIAFVKLRYKQPDEDTSRLLQRPLLLTDIKPELDATSETYRFSAAVAWMGQVLRNNQQLHNRDLNSVITLAEAAKGSDPHGYRSEFVNLARTAQALAVVPVNGSNAASGG